MKNIPFCIIAALVALAPLARAKHKTSYGLYGQSLKAKSEKPDIFGNRKTTQKGHNTLNFFRRRRRKNRVKFSL